MTRIQRLKSRANESAERNRVQVDLRIREPISPDLRRLLTSAEHTKGAWIWKECGWTFFGHVVKTNNSEDLPAFGAQVAEAMRQAKREGKRLIIVRYP